MCWPATIPTPNPAWTKTATSANTVNHHDPRRDQRVDALTVEAGLGQHIVSVLRERGRQEQAAALGAREAGVAAGGHPVLPAGPRIAMDDVVGGELGVVGQLDRAASGRGG